MRNLKFHLIKATNILCFGPEGIQIHFDDYSNIVQVCGTNLDAPADKDHPASNGAGKSSIQELISIALYGRTVKSPTNRNTASILNVLATKGEVEIQWDDFRLVRTYSKSKTGTVKCSLQIWKSNNRIWDETSDITKGQGSPEVQKYVEDQIGLSHHAFCNVVIFDDLNKYSFLEADTPTKRQIVENLLDLDQYRQYHQNAKEIIKDFKKKVDLQTREYEMLGSEVDACNRRITTISQQEINWKSTKQNELKDLMQKIKTKQDQLGKTDTGEQLANWQKAQERMTALAVDIESSESRRGKLSEAIDEAKKKLDVVRQEKQSISESIQGINIGVKQLRSEIAKNKTLIDSLQSLKEGTTCPVCHAVVNRDNYGHVIEHAHAVSDKSNEELTKQSAIIEEYEGKAEKKSAAISTMGKTILEAQGKLAVLEDGMRNMRQELMSLSKISKPDSTANEQILEAEITEMKKQLKNKKEEYEGDSPYKEIMNQATAEKTKKEQEKKDKEKELADSEAETPYYEFWAEAFGDNGIRKFVVDGIIPSLNERVAYWLQILIDGIIHLEFDNKLDATVTRKGNSADYKNMSNGERRRINLAVSQAFAYIMMLSSGNCPSLVFLDEITGGGVDRAGISGIYNMIFELCKERQVFVTTHNENLMSLLQGCQSINLRKQDDITVLIP